MESAEAQVSNRSHLAASPTQPKASKTGSPKRFRSKGQKAKSQVNGPSVVGAPSSASTASVTEVTLRPLPDEVVKVEVTCPVEEVHEATGASSLASGTHPEGAKIHPQPRDLTNDEILQKLVKDPDRYIANLRKTGTKSTAQRLATVLTSKNEGEVIPVLKECSNPACDLRERLEACPVREAKLKCRHISELLSMFHGHIAPQVMDALTVPCQFFAPTDDDSIYKQSSGLLRQSSVHPAGHRHAISSARMSLHELRVVVGPLLHDVDDSHWETFPDAPFRFAHMLFKPPGLKTLFPQSAKERLIVDGQMVQALSPFQERKNVCACYCIMRLHKDARCFAALALNDNIHVFDNKCCQAIISRVLGETCNLIYFDFITNFLLVVLWVFFSNALRKEWTRLSLTSCANILLALYFFGLVKLILEFLGATMLDLQTWFVRSLHHWWHLFQIVVSLVCLVRVLGNDHPSPLLQAASSSVILAQWVNALFCVRIIRSFGESIKPILSALFHINIATFIVMLAFCTFGMSHFFYNLGNHWFWDTLMITYNLGLLGSFDYGELEASELQQFVLNNVTNVIDEVGDKSSFHSTVRLFVVCVTLVVTVLLMNVLIGMLSENFSNAYQHRSRLYWKGAAEVALSFAAEHYGYCWFVKAVTCGRFSLTPAILLEKDFVDAETCASSQAQSHTRLRSDSVDSLPHDYLWFSFPADEQEQEQDEMANVMEALQSLQRQMTLLQEQNRRLLK